MEFVDNTGHVFSLPSFNEKPIGYEYEENEYVFWLNDRLEYRLSINNYYVKPIYFIYETSNPDDLEIKIYFNNSNIFKLLSPISIQEKISSLESLDDFIRFDSDSDIIKSELNNDDLYAVSTAELRGDVEYEFNMFPLYVIGLSEEEGTWLSNLMIYINDNGYETWCPITIGGMFVNEYEELIINGQNMGISLPKDILKSIYQESIYNDEYNVELYNKKLKEYLLNYMGIRGELGNYNSVLNSLKWFGYGNKISISKLLKTDNSIQTQFIRNYFNIEGDMLKSFNKFKLDALVSLMIMINKESDETYPIDFEREFLMGENKPKLIDLINHLEKVKIGNHDMEIDDDPEKYFYWKTYFDFSFTELGIKLSLLKYYYEKYFLPLHLNVHTASLGHLVFANDMKMHSSVNINIAQPIATAYNEEFEIEFPGNNVHYYTKQIHYIDSNFNEFSSNYMNIHDNNEIFYKMDDTCINIPIKFKNTGLYNCILLLERENYENIQYIHYIDKELTLELRYDYNGKYFEYKYPLIKFFKNKKEYVGNIKYAYIYGNEKLYSDYFDSYDKMIDHAITTVLKRSYNFDNDMSINDKIKIKILCDADKFDYIRFDYKLFGIIDEDERYEKFYNDKIYLDNSCDALLESHFSFYLSNTDDYQNFILYPKKINVKNLTDSKYFEYWVNSNFILKLCVNNKWYEYEFKTMINKPVLDFGRLKYKYFLNNANDIIKSNISCDDLKHYLLIVGNNDFDSFNNELDNIEFDHTNKTYEEFIESFDYETMYDSLNINGDNSLIVQLDKSSKIYDSVIDYGMVSLFPQLQRITDKISFNAYINDHDLVEVNNINYDIDFYKIIKYHLDNNLHYLDGELINDSFFKYIEYYTVIKINDARIEKFFNNPKNNIWGLECYLKENNIYNKYFIKYNKAYKAYHIYDVYGNFIKEWEGIDEYMLRYQIYLHPSLYKKDIVVINTMLSNLGHNLLYAYDSNVYLLREVDKNANNYEIINSDAHIFETEDELFYILLEKKVFEYKGDEDCYVCDDKKYYVYDKLYQNEESIYKHYSYMPNIVNNDRYLNNIHLFNIYERHYKYTNILQFNKNIDLRVNGVNFKYITRSKKDYSDDILPNNIIYNDEFEISGPIYHDVIDTDTRYPDAYGLYWDKVFIDKHRYQYNFTNLYEYGYYSIIKELDDNTYFDTEKNKVTVKETQHIIVNNLLHKELILKYNDIDDKYYTYNDYMFENSKYEFTIYDIDKETILCTGIALIDREESYGKIEFKIEYASQESFNDQIYYIKNSNVNSSEKYRLMKNDSFMNMYISVNDTIEVPVYINEDNITISINNIDYILNNTDETHVYEYILDENFKKNVYFEKIPAYEISCGGRFPKSFIIEKDSEDNYYQYLINENQNEYRKTIYVVSDYYKYLYIQEEPYRYLNYGVYIKRIYNKDKTFDKLEEISIDDINNESLLNEYYYHKDDEYTKLGVCHFKTLEDFYNGNYIEDSKTFEGNLRLDKNIYKWIDPKYFKINDIEENYEYDLSYKIYIVVNGENKPLTSNSVIGDEYDYVVVTFYYNKLILIKNKYYTLNEFLESPYINATRDRDGKYYLNDKICYVEENEYYKYDLYKFDITYIVNEVNVQYTNINDYTFVKKDNKFYNIYDDSIYVEIYSDKDSTEIFEYHYKDTYYGDIVSKTISFAITKDNEDNEILYEIKNSKIDDSQVYAYTKVIDNYVFIKKEDNKFYNEDNDICEITIDNNRFIYEWKEEIDDELINKEIIVDIKYVDIQKRYFVVADEYRAEVLKVSSIKRYVDYYGNDIKIQNPSGYWYDIDNDEIRKLDRSLNELQRYWFIENESDDRLDSENTIKEIEEQFKIYTNKLQNSLEYGLNMDNFIELRYRYKNYLAKELTGLKGLFKLDWDVEDNLNENKELFNLCVCITRSDDTVEIYNKKKQKFELYGDEKEVIVYFRLDTKNTDIEQIKKFIAKPRILTVSEYNTQLKYKYKESGDTITVRVNNKEFKYGDNSSQNIIDLYNRFFVNKYNLYDLYIDSSFELKDKLLYSIYECNDNINIDNDVKYDFYLMHDNEYWYGLYISRNTCDMIEYKNINIPETSKTLYLDDDYALKYVKSSKEFLINRMKYISANGYNHFGDNEIICAKMTNNDRLPIRTDISAKWNIHGMSLGMNLKNEFESSAETTIIGLPKNDNKYQKGYYSVTVRYSLDRDLQHQYKDTGTFRVG